MFFLKSLTTTAALAAAAAAAPAQATASTHSSASLPGLDEIPSIGLGTWLSDKGEVAHAVSYALGEAGYNHIDAALIYRNEDQTGKGIAASGLPRDKIWVTSKLWNTHHRRDQAEAAIRKSIADLGVDYLDLYLIHWPVAFVPEGEFGSGSGSGSGSFESRGPRLDHKTTLLETWRTLESLVRANLTRHIGLSNFARADVEHILAAAEIKPYAHELETHPYLQQQAFVDWHADVGVKVIAYSPLANTNPTYRDRDGDGDDVLPAIQDDPFWKDLASEKRVSVFQAVLAWGVQRGTAVIPKSTKESHILSNREALGVRFTDEEMREIAARDKKHRLNDPSKSWGVQLFADLDGHTELGDGDETREEL